MDRCNAQGFTGEEYEELVRIERKPKRERTPDEEKRLEEMKEKQKLKNNAISILRGISIRMPLLIYGADIPIDEDITMEKLVDIVDDSSWEEFMPTGVTKEMFKNFIKYYDPEIFVAAGRRIRTTVLSADELSPTERVKKIAQLFACFKNPDKETVLTPWRVVNMHMSDCLGGYDFYDEVHEQMVDEPRFVDRGKVTADTFANAGARVLEINSKTGLYPLYVTYSIFRSRCAACSEEELDDAKLQQFWDTVVRENVFVICKTPMAKQITRRTLAGYRDIPVNAHYFDDLINMMKNKPRQFVDRVLKPSYWKQEGVKTMKFDAVVGNPPYQLSGGSGGTNDAPIYQYFVASAQKLQADYTSLIIPSRWFSGGRENLLAEFRHEMLKNGGIEKMFVFPDSHEIFSSVEIKGGLCYFLSEEGYSGECEYTLVKNGVHTTIMRNLNDFDILIREPLLANIVKKVMANSPQTVILTNVNVATNHPGYSGTGFVDSFGEDGDAVTMDFYLNQEGDYNLNFIYSAAVDGTPQRQIYIDGYGFGEIQFPPNGSWDEWTSSRKTVHLRRGIHRMVIQAEGTTPGYINLDRVDISTAG